jgi:hypothetical protein
VHWPTLTVDEAATAWDQLGQWVAETFVPRYEGAEVWVMTWTSHDPLNEVSEPDAGTDSYRLARSRPHADNDPNT